MTILRAITAGESQAALMAALGARHDALSGIVPPQAPIIYFDVPVHHNLGDLLIYAGTEALLARFGWHITHRFSVLDYRHFLDAVTDRHVLLLHGGGNMGDLWPGHEPMRQDLLRRFRNKTVVLPQTIHFQDRAAAAACGAAYREHPDCTVLVRDAVSRRVAEDWMGVTCAVMPDMAHALWWSGDPFGGGPSGSGELCLRRTDKEAPGGVPASEGIDWRDVLTIPDRVFRRLLVRAMTRNRDARVQRALTEAWRWQRDRLIARAAALFARHESIRSDRLHAALLGCLLGKDVSIIDNSYGKLSSYFDTWMPPLTSLVSG